MTLIFILFFTLFLGLWSAVHWLAWQVLTVFLPLGPLARRILLGFLILSAISFPAINFLIRAYSGTWVKSLYHLNSLWLGAMNYIFLACLAAGLFYLAARLLKLQPNMAYVTVLLLTAALGLAAYGWWQARHPVFTRLTIPIADLPAAWEGGTIAQLSDVHLGAILDAEYMAGLASRLNRENIAAVFITGDYFDGSCLDLDRLAAPLKDLSAPKGLYFITGNHETYIGVERVFAALEKYGVTVLDNGSADIEGLKVLGLSYAEPGNRPDRSALFAGLDPKIPTVLLYHSPGYIKEAGAAGVDLQLAGHTHWGQLWPYGYITRLIYGRFHKGLNWNGGQAVYTTAGAGTWGPPSRVGARPEVVLITLVNK